MGKIYFFLLLIFTSLSFSQSAIFEKKSVKFLHDNQYDSAAVYTQKVIKSYINDEDKFKLGNAYIQYARILKSISRSDSCFYFLDKAESIFNIDKTKYSENLFYILFLKAETCRYLGKRDLAIKFINQATQKNNNRFNPNIQAYYENRRMAIVAEYYNNVPDSVKVIHNLATSIIKKTNQIDDKSLVVYTYNEIGFLDFNKSREKALKYFQLAYDIAQKYKCKMALIDVCINLGRLYQQKYSDFDKAIEYNKIGLKNAKEINNFWQIKEIYGNLKNCYSLKNDYKTALFYSDSISGAIIKIIEKENALIVDEIEKKYNYVKKDSELKKTEQNFKYLIIILIFVFLGLAVLLYFNRKIRENNKQLKQLNEENEFLLSETNHRINNNLQLIVILISDELRKLNNDENSHIKKILSKVESIATLHRHLYQSKNKNEVEISSYLSEIRINFNEIFKENNVIVTLNSDKKVLQIDQGMYLGLLLTELFINSLKHAFENSQNHKTIDVKFESIENGYKFYYNDNGALSKGQLIKPKLVEKICRQLRVAFTIQSENGFKIFLEKNII